MLLVGRYIQDLKFRFQCSGVGTTSLKLDCPKAACLAYARESHPAGWQRSGKPDTMPRFSPSGYSGDCKTVNRSDPHSFNLIPYECGQSKGGQIPARQEPRVKFYAEKPALVWQWNDVWVSMRQTSFHWANPRGASAADMVINCQCNKEKKQLTTSQIHKNLHQPGNSSQTSQQPPESLAEALEYLAQKNTAQGPNIGDIIDSFADKSFGLLFLVLSLPSALPVPAPGYSTPFGLVIVLLSIQMLWGRRKLWIPEKLRNVRMKKTLAQKILSTGARNVRYLERFIRPRQYWIGSTFGLRIMAIVLIFMGCLMIMPIPLTNTAPAGVVFLLGLGLAEDDGLLALLSFAAGTVAIAIYVYVIYLFFAYGPETVENLFAFLRPGS